MQGNGKERQINLKVADEQQLQKTITVLHEVKQLLQRHQTSVIVLKDHETSWNYSYVPCV